MAARSPSGAGRGDDIRDAVLDAARRLLAEEGPDALTVRRIAAAAGGSTMNVYSRFGGKDGVVEALFVEGFRELATAMEEVPTTDDPVADLLGCSWAYRHFALGHPTSYAVMFERIVRDLEPSEAARAQASATLTLLAARVQRAVDAGAIVSDDVLGTATGLWAANHGLVSLELKGVGPPSTTWDEVHRATMTALARGLAPAPGPVVRRPKHR